MPDVPRQPDLPQPPAPIAPAGVTGVASPCVRLCTLDDHDMCVGCGRTLDDIRTWSAMGDEAKRQCVQRAHQRLRDAGLEVRTTPVPPGQRLGRR